MAIVLEHTRKITFEVHDYHPRIGAYCVFANEKPEDTDIKHLDFVYVEDIIEEDGNVFVKSPDLFQLVLLKYCWNITIKVHD